MNNKTLVSMKNFAEAYAKRTDTFFCVDSSVTIAVIKGLADHKEEIGGALCPCRWYDDKEDEVSSSFWNCPCVPMRERKECHCMLFVTKDNPYASDRREIKIEMD